MGRQHHPRRSSEVPAGSGVDLLELRQLPGALGVMIAQRHRHTVIHRQQNPQVVATARPQADRSARLQGRVGQVDAEGVV